MCPRAALGQEWGWGSCLGLRWGDSDANAREQGAAWWKGVFPLKSRASPWRPRYPESHSEGGWGTPDLHGAYWEGTREEVVGKL